MIQLSVEDCIFCKIIKGESPATIVFENEHVVAFKSIKPVSDIHILVIPKVHIPTFMDLKNREIVQNLATAAQEIILQMKIEKGYKLVVNGGKYQEVKHLHWHILGGKFKDDWGELKNT